MTHAIANIPSVGVTEPQDVWRAYATHARKYSGNTSRELRLETLPYLDTLRWSPTSNSGASEKLQIGTRDEEKVFAYFDRGRPSIYQLSIFQGNVEHEMTEVVKKGMWSVEFLKPFSYWMSRAENGGKIAQRFRTYLRACFVLRGHAAGGSVVIDMHWFPRVVSVIETKRLRHEKQVNEAGRLMHPATNYHSRLNRTYPFHRDVKLLQIQAMILQQHEDSMNMTPAPVQLPDRPRTHGRPVRHHQTQVRPWKTTCWTWTMAM